MILGPNPIQKRNEIDPYPPTNCLPIQAHSFEFGGLRTLIAIGPDSADGDDACLNEGENKVSRCHLCHEFIERIPLRWHCASATRDNRLRSPIDRSGFGLPTSSVRSYNPFGNPVSRASSIALRRQGVWDRLRIRRQPSSPSPHRSTACISCRSRRGTEAFPLWT